MGNEIVNSKVILPFALVISALIISVGLYNIQHDKQLSIERQQALELAKDRETEKTKSDLAQKEFEAKRKQNCLEIYKTEGEKWNNVRGWRYNESEDACLVRYKDNTPKSDAECDKAYPINNDSFVFIYDNALCKQGEFENTF